MRALVCCLFAVAAAGCTVQGPSGEPAPENIGTSAQAVTASEAIERAEEWVAAKLLYCQSPNGASDSVDPACPAICMRQSNPEWDPYRSDCSGLVSWAWGLPPPGRTTGGFAPNQTDITTVIEASSLQMGDAVNTDDAVSKDHHVMLFKEWTVPGKQATFIEEPGCSAKPDYAHEFTSNVAIHGTAITVAYNGIAFQAIRYAALDQKPPPCDVNGVAGICILASDCAAMPDHVSTPGHCPGPASEECCTPKASASGAGGAGGAGGADGASAASGTGGAAGASSGPKGPNAGPEPAATSAASSCQLDRAASPPATSAAALAALLLLRRRRRRYRAARSSSTTSCGSSPGPRS